jgi:hypothetical protein
MVNVDPRLSVTARPTAAYVSAQGPAEVALTGIIVPSRSETLGFLVQRFKGGKWLPFATVTSRVQHGKAHTVFRTSQKGAYRVQAHFSGDSKYGPGFSAWAKFSVAR